MGGRPIKKMKNIARLNLPKVPQSERLSLMDKVATFIRVHTQPLQVLFFGSITADKFDAMSDVDVVAIFRTQEEATQARKSLYGADLSAVGRPIDFLCVDQETFDSKSQIGGVYFIARESGISR